jgi:hypothetical protein
MYVKKYFPSDTNRWVISKHVIHRARKKYAGTSFYSTCA